MKVEKISDNKIKITLTIDELSERKITLKEIEKNHSKAQNLFMDLIEESNLQEEFINENTELFVEATSDNSNFFMITITKVDYIKPLPNYDLLKISNDSQNKINNRKINNTKNSISKKITNTEKISKERLTKTSHNIKSIIYKFDNFKNLNDFCKKAIYDNLFIGINCLYKYNQSYFVVFKNSTVKNENFITTFKLLSEYCSSYYSSKLYKALISEKANLILDNKAIEYLAEF